jgi:hypothetical protein
MTGLGVANYTNEAVYKGLFSNGKRQGQGTMSYANGTEASGIWINGALEGGQTETAKPKQTEDQN